VSPARLVTLLAAAAAALATGGAAAAAGTFAGQDIDPQFRARIMKEKVKLNQQRAASFDFTKDGDLEPDAHCGSQSIGNIDTGGRIGAAPREVFVFAPNAINIVGRGGC
jgi:hypothetical protein